MWMRWKVGPPKAGKWQVIYFSVTGELTEVTCIYHPPPGTCPPTVFLSFMNRLTTWVDVAQVQPGNVHTNPQIHSHTDVNYRSHWFKVITFAPDYLLPLPLPLPLPLHYSTSRYLHNEWTWDTLLGTEIKHDCYYGRKCTASCVEYPTSQRQ